MNKKLIYPLLLLLCVFQIAEALLPPFYQTRNEYQTLLNSKELEEKLGSGQAILSITLKENYFKILTPKYSLIVEIIYEKSELIGPAKFHLSFQDPQPLNSLNHANNSN